MDEKLKELRNLLEELPDVYDDFIGYVLLVAEDDNVVDELLEFMETYDNLTTDYVLDYVADLRHIEFEDDNAG